jgi:methionyl-tRNA formyltransferase
MRGPPCESRAVRIAFFGLPLGGLLLDADGHELVLACVSSVTAPGLRRLERRLGERVLRRPDVRAPGFAERVRAARPELVVSWFWTSLLPLEVIEAAPQGGIGAHPSLLPRHRGPDPTYWAIRRGDHETGVSVHRLGADYDTGEVLAVERLVIAPHMTAWRLAKALDRPSLRLLRATVARLARGEVLTGQAQDEARATSAPFPSEDDCALSFDVDPRELLLQIRAASPAPGAFTELDGEPLVVLEARLFEGPLGLAPGEIAVIEGAVVLGARGGGVEVLEAELAGAPIARHQLAKRVTSLAGDPRYHADPEEQR